MERNNGLMLLAGLAIGAGAMALIDPGRGARRRSWLRDKLSRGAHSSNRQIDKKARHIRNEAFGAISERKARLFNRHVPDEILEERVKAQIGHVLSHCSVDVRAHGGHVTIEGPVLRGERQKIADRLDVTRGVRSYDLFVREHDSDEGLPSLQGASRFQRRAG
ncbi:MAG TPA: hypothetical protein VN577_19865 [Terriglobales bacterium]|nr:hypothetical protein [Terriglobales bacterium]